MSPARAGLLVGAVLLMLDPRRPPGPLGHRDRHGTATLQTVYRNGVPHTTRTGTLRLSYGADSFFPRCLYHAVAGSFATIRAAGFNCVHLWEGHDIADVFATIDSAGLQLLAHWPTDGEVRKYRDDPHLLGWYLDEEPTAQTWIDVRRTGDTALMARRYQAFLTRKAAINTLDPGRPVFAIDRGWIPPGYAAWWDRWNTAGDISVQDDYVMLARDSDLSALAASVSRAVRINHERKPVWVTLQTFTGSAAMRADFRMPSAAELRGMAFTAVVHGATGLILFAYDSHVTRQGLVVGIAPDTPETGGDYASATPREARASRTLWIAAVALNSELSRLESRILSRTATLDYRVRFPGSGDGRSRSAAGPVRTMLKQRGSGYTLFAVNVAPRPHRGRFEFPLAAASVERLNPDGSHTRLVLSGAGFTDTLGALGAAVYDIDLR